MRWPWSEKPPTPRPTTDPVVKELESQLKRLNEMTATLAKLVEKGEGAK